MGSFTYSGKIFHIGKAGRLSRIDLGIDPHPSMPPLGYIAVHGGAGVHGTAYEKEVKRALKRACIRGLTVLTTTTATIAQVRNTSALSMVEQAITVLEDDEHLNAGYGSNLTIEGIVECDASIMCGNSAKGGFQFGSVGAVSGVKNPITLARAILDYSNLPNSIGRVPPMTLASSGAYKFALAQGIETVPDDALIAVIAQKQWTTWKRRLEGNEGIEGRESLRDIEDTVGAVAFHQGDGMAAGVSSGGLLLKQPGRVGEAAVYGAGCWTTGRMACSVSGTGEHIVRANLARKIGEALHAGDGDPHDVLKEVLIEFWESCRRRGEISPSVGVILLAAEVDESAGPRTTGNAAVRMWCAFTTASMAAGYASTEHPKPKTVILRHPNPGNSGGPQVFITSLSL